MHKLIATEDGSLSIRDAETGELYHNKAGAFTEAMVNYVQPSGVLFAPETCGKDGKLRIIDVCFGLGYNSLALLANISQAHYPFRAIQILGIEQDPEVLKLIPQILKYHQFNALVQYIDVARLTTFGGYSFRMGNISITVEIVQDSIRKLVPQLVDSRTDFHLPGIQTRRTPRSLAQERDWDMIFHDPFSAKHVPELWTIDFFRCYHQLLRARSGRMLTYSSARAVRSGIKSAGFHVFRSTALGGKSGGTVGDIVDRQLAQSGPHIFPLTQEENARLSSASGIPYRDETFVATAADIRMRRLVEQIEWKQRERK